MKNIKYFDILKQAALITWKNKFLWFFGFLVFLGSIGANFDLNIVDENTQQQGLQFIADFIQRKPEIFAIVSIFVVMFVIVLFLLRILAIVSLIKSVKDLNLYRQLSFKTILKEALAYLNRLLLLELMISLSLILILVIMAMPVLYLFSLNAGILAYLTMAIAIVISLPLVLLAHYLIKYAGFYVVLTDAGLKIALESAYVIFAKNILESLIMSLSISAGVFCLLVGVLLVGMSGVMIFGLIAFLAYFIFAKTGAIAVLLFGSIIFIAMLVIIFSWFASFLYTAWMLFFQQIAFEKHGDKKVLEKIENIEEIPSPEVV